MQDFPLRDSEIKARYFSPALILLDLNSNKQYNK